MRPALLLSLIIAACSKDFTPPPSGDCDDADGDFYCDAESGGVDCDDNNASIHPGAIEVWYDSMDQDCDGNDADFDLDGYDAGADCDDRDPDVNPGVAETWYDAADSDCDGANDFDADADGYVNEYFPKFVGGTAPEGGDCDDHDASIHPGADDPPDDGVDQDCDGPGDVDADGDGFSPESDGGDDCDDDDPTVFPGADETCDGEDEDCDDVIDEEAIDTTLWYADIDDDGYGDASDPGLDACEGPSASTDNNQDCDDTNPAAFPGADEYCNTEDDDCDDIVDEDVVGLGTWYLDGDEDSFGDADDAGVESCETLDGRVVNNLDCDDDDSAIYPGATEICDGEDEDCDVTIDEEALDAAIWYLDDDGDGYGLTLSTTESCEEPSGYSDLDGDCDDGDDDVYPGAAEIWYDGVDGDCEGGDDYDADLDGYRSLPWGADCDDGDDDVYPGAAEIWYDGVDGDCDGADDYDADADGYGSSDYGDEDCDDDDPDVNPDAIEAMDDGEDSDCDGDDDTATFHTLTTATFSGLQGPRLAEHDLGVVVGVVGERAWGTANPGTLWHFLDPSTPWDGSTHNTGWYYLTGSTSIGEGYDLTADGNYILETFVSQSSAATNLAVTNTLVTTGATTTRETGLIILDTSLDFTDMHISFDGSTVGIVHCEATSANKWVTWMEGTFADFFSTSSPWVYGQNNATGGEVCAGRVSQSDMLVSNDSANTVSDYSFTGSTVGLNTTSSGAWTLLDYAQSGSAYALAYVDGSSIYLSNGSATSSDTFSGLAVALKTARYGSTVYAVYATSSGDAHLIYGVPGAALTTAPLEPGFNVRDVDVWASSTGALIVAALSTSDQLAFMGVEI